MERRLKSPTKGSPLPDDYLKMVTEVFTTNFDPGMKALKKITSERPYFKVVGQVHLNEVVLCISLMIEGQMAATSVYASGDFDPKASAPTIQDILAASVDAIGSIYDYMLSPAHPERLEQVAQQSLASLEDIPFEWTQTESGRFKIFLKVDKANPELDAMADDWLKKHDPDLEEREKREHEETEKLFFTGPKRGKPPGSGSVH